MNLSRENDVLGLLDHTIEQLDSLGTGFSREIETIKGIRNRLVEGRFHLAVLGQFKRGKSSLLNALLGEYVLPVAVIPLTATPTLIQAGQQMLAKILFSDKKEPAECKFDDPGKLADFLSRYVTETNNPANKFNVQQVEVSHPAEILRNGVILIDTPGIGSTFKHNTEATLNFLLQCDAAMFLVSADPPITEVEIEFLKQVKRKVPHLFFILNKVDYLNEQEKEEILSFIKKVLLKQVGIEKDINVFCVSARLGLKAKQSYDENLRIKSGIDKIETYLIDFLANEKTEALQTAVRKKAVDILAEVLMQVQLSIKSLQIPLDDLERKLKIFAEKLDELEQSKLSEMDILEGDKKRMHEFLEKHAEQLRQKSRTYLKGAIENAFSKMESEQLNEDTIEKSLADAIPVFFEHEMGKSTEFFQNKMTKVLGPHRERLDKLIDSIHRTAAELFDIPYREFRFAQNYEITRRPYWVSHQWISSFRRIPRSIFDKLLPSGNRKSQLDKKAIKQINELVMQNVENLRWAVFQNIDQSFIRFRSELQKRFEQALTATRGAIETGLKKRKEHSEIVSGEIIRIEESLEILTNIMESLKSAGKEFVL